jgi:hypothetical protein
VGIGASAGGLKALKDFFSSMPIDTCMAFVVAPHLDPTHQSLMHELLARETRMPVCEAEEDMTVERSHVYIIPPARYLTIGDGTLHLIEPQESRGTQSAIDHVLDVLRTRTWHDFRSDRKNMLMRRVQRRMSLCHIEKFPDYLDYLWENTGEVTALVKDLLIGVTGLFREPEVFAQHVIPDLVARSCAATDTGRPVRVWVPGCTTGEEAYSLAILFSEQFDAMNKPVNFQIFASDIDSAARRHVSLFREIMPLSA